MVAERLTQKPVTLESLLINTAEGRGLAYKREELIHLSQALKTDYLYPDQQTVAITQYLLESIAKKYSLIEAIGISGGNANGGTALKRVFSPSHLEEDYDAFAIVSSPPRKYQDIDISGRKVNPVHFQLWTLSKDIQNKIELLKRTKNQLVNGLSDAFQLCDVVNYTTSYVADIRSLNLHEITSLLLSNQWSNLVLFFLPTYPEEVGISCRNKVLESLRLLAKSDPKSWKLITALIKKQWREFRQFKPKYLLLDATQLSVQEIEQLTDEWNKSFDELIDSTSS